MKLCTAVCFVLSLLVPPPALIRTAVASSVEEVLPGQVFTISGYLFNDDPTQSTRLMLGIDAPVGFTLIKSSSTYTETPLIGPNASIHLSWNYRMEKSARVGPTRFQLVVYDDAALPVARLTKVLTIMAQPVVAPPAVVHQLRVYLPVWRA